jgi:catechol 2,3-dioxygenase-like lactoylglutathione lyase family enzyme
VSRIHHVNVVIPVGTTEQAVAFYGRVLGLTHVPRPGEDEPQSTSGAWFDVAPRMQVHISERDGEPHPDAHFGIVVDDFDGVRQRLAGAGAPWTDQEPLFDGRRGFTRDPAGDRIELIEDGGSA